MKTKNDLEVISYKNSSIENLVQETHESTMDIARSSAKDMSAMNRPTPDEHLEAYTGNLSSSYNSLSSKVAAISGIENVKAKGSATKKRYDDREKELKESVTILRNETSRLKSTIDKMNIESVLVRLKRWSVVHVLIIALLFGEVALNEQSLSMLTSGGIIFRLFLAFGISCVFYLFVWGKHILSLRITNPYTRFFVLSVLTGIVTIGLYGLAEIRLLYNQEVTKNVSDISIHLFVGINMLFYLAALISKLSFGVTPDEKAKWKLYKKLKAEHVKKEQTLQSQSKELESLPERRDTELGEYLSIIKMGLYYQDLIQNHHIECLTEYIHHVNINRTDGKTISLENYKNGVPSLNIYSFNNETL